MGRSLGEMNSGADKAKGVTGYEGILPPADKGRAESGQSKAPKVSKEEVLQRFVDETPSTQGGRKGFATDVTPVRKSTIPTQRMGTVAEGQTRARTKDVSVPFAQMHSQYSDAINTARNIRKNPLTPDQHDALDLATTHLMHSIVSYHRARSEGGLGTPNMHNPTAHTHLHEAVKHLTYAHETLVQSGVHEALASRRMTTSMPKDSHVADLSAKSTTLEGQGVGGVQGAKKPYSRGVLGRSSEMSLNEGVLTIQHPKGTIEIPQKDLHHLAGTFGRNHPAIQKMNAMMGTQRGKQMRVSKEERREGVVDARGAGVATDAPAGRNPKKRGSGRMVRTEFRSDANRIGTTPTFGEGGKSGTIEGYSPQPAKRSEGTGGPGIEQQTPNPQAQEATKAVRKIPSGKPGPGKLMQRRLKNNGK